MIQRASAAVCMKVLDLRALVCSHSCVRDDAALQAILDTCPANLVTNGGFEDGMTGFTVSGETAQDITSGDFGAFGAEYGEPVHSGSNSFYVANTQPASLLQTLPSCVPAAPTCTLSLYYLVTTYNGLTAGIVFSASVGGVTVLDSATDPQLTYPTGSNKKIAANYALVTSPPFAYTPGAVLNITAANAPDETFFDDVSIVCQLNPPAAGVIEPPSPEPTPQVTMEATPEVHTAVVVTVNMLGCYVSDALQDKL